VAQRKKGKGLEKNMVRAIYAGSFDPVTFGHLDIIVRASRVVEELVVGVLNNRAKSPLFSVEERVKMLEEVTKEYPNVKIRSFTGLLVEFAKECEARVIVRGLRAITDFDYELQMAQTNRIMNPDLDTIFLTTSLEYAYLSSTTVKEVAGFGGNISAFVPPFVEKKIQERMEALSKG
jgi:pantetheine-phosphate adenylyltransferase